MTRTPPPLNPPYLVQLLVAASATRDVRDAVLGDLQEEYARRARVDSTSATVWLWSQAIQSLGPWTAYRLRRSTRARAMLGILAGVIAAPAMMVLLNTPTILELVRSVPADARVTLARALNWAAVAVAGYVAARVAVTPPRGFGLALGATMLVLWSLGWGMALGTAPLIPGLVPTVPLLTAATLGAHLGATRIRRTVD